MSLSCASLAAGLLAKDLSKMNESSVHLACTNLPYLRRRGEGFVIHLDEIDSDSDLLLVLRPGVLGQLGVGVAVPAPDEDFPVGARQSRALVGVGRHVDLLQLALVLQRLHPLLLHVPTIQEGRGAI